MRCLPGILDRRGSVLLLAFEIAGLVFVWPTSTIVSANDCSGKRAAKESQQINAEAN
jgi:hypothetical protein